MCQPNWPVDGASLVFKICLNLSYHVTRLYWDARFIHRSSRQNSSTTSSGSYYHKPLVITNETLDVWETLSRWSYVHTCPVDLQLGTYTCENRYFSVSRLFMHAVKSFQSEFLQRIPVTCTDNKKNIYIYLYIYISFTVKSFWGGCGD